MHIHYFVFNPFQENTYIINSDNGDCMIIDPGCHNNQEEQELTEYIKVQKLTPKYLLNTHAHIDHILGNNFVASSYNLPLYLHKDDLDFLSSAKKHAAIYDLNLPEEPIRPKYYLKEGDDINLGDLVFNVHHVPGHAPGHVVFVCHSQKFVIAGDTLFKGNIGRTDLPGGDYDTLINSIKEKLFTLPDDYRVYCGHGSMTAIGEEKNTNPFFN